MTGPTDPALRALAEADDNGWTYHEQKALRLVLAVQKRLPVAALAAAEAAPLIDPRVWSCNCGCWDSDYAALRSPDTETAGDGT